MKVLGGILLSMFFVGCAAKLPVKVADNKPRGGGVAINLGAINFTHYASGEDINLRQYMIDNDKDYLLLTFGSKGCGSCNAKAKKLTQTVIGQHPLFLTEEGRRFDIIGINTDKTAYPKMASYLSKYPFIQWNDPGGLAMIQHFMPFNEAFSVPLTALVTRIDGERAEWIIPPSESVTVKQIMKMVVDSLGIGDATPTPGDDDDDDDHTDPIDVPASPLDMPLPGRLKGVAVTGCDTRATHTLDDLFGDAERRILQVAASCNADCQANIEAFTRLNATCTNCKAITLVQDTSAASHCAVGNVYQGGAEFFSDKFKSLFNWDYEVEVVMPTYEVKIAAVEGPLVLAFDKTGPILHTAEKAVSDGILASWISSTETVNRGPDFPLYRKVSGQAQHFTFSDYRRQSKYTIVNIWSGGPPPCGNCIEELKHWSEDDGLFDFCAANPATCQVMALEAAVPHPVTDAALSSYFDGWIEGIPGDFEGFNALGIKAKVVLDPRPLDGETGLEFKDRFFDGYVQALQPDLFSDPRTIIYDREGKMIATYITPVEPMNEPDHVFLKIKELMQIEAELGVAE